MSAAIDVEKTARTQARYDHIAPVYDLMEVLPERKFGPWREKLWAQVPQGRVLEVGVGTGKNFPYHPPGIEVVGIDISERMLERAQQRAEELGEAIELHQMDAQQLDFPDDVFDAAVATFVFCSVPDAVQGLLDAGTALAFGSDAEEGIKGTLSPGKLADLMVLSQDIFAIDPMAILETKVVATMFDGEWVYARNELLE
jgi:SAM-dependent methyltransferase